VNGISVDRPILTALRSPDWISSYSLERLMPVGWTAVAMRTDLNGSLNPSATIQSQTFS